MIDVQNSEMTVEEVVEETKADRNEPNDAGKKPDLSEGTPFTEQDSEQPEAKGANIPFKDSSTPSNTHCGLGKKIAVPAIFK